MANIIEIIIKANNQASGALDSALEKVSGVGKSMQDIGAKMAVATAPIALALGVAVSSAMSFDSAMTNTASVLGKTRTEMVGLNKEVLRIGANSRAGPQAAAEAMYDIAGGVQDASTHMAILQAAINTAEAGSADLGSTTNALIAVMNSYGFAAEDAAFASDVLTRTVGMGVGSMSDFAASLPAITGLANSLSIKFDDLAGATAYLTTQGNTASQATTQLSGMMAALINPSEKMRDALSEMGFSSGRAAVESLGLVGTYEKLIATFGVDAVGPMVGQMEAVRGITALTGDGFTEFSQKFVDGVNGATAAAQQIQLDSPAAQMDLLNSKVSALGITVGGILLPPLMDLIDQVAPLAEGVLAWAQANPEAMTTVLGVAMAAVAAGPVIGILGTAITGVTTAIGFLLSPAVLLAGAIAAIVAAAQIGYPGGIVGLFNDATTTAQQLAFLGLYMLNLAAQTARQGLINLAAGLGEAFTKAGEFARGIAGVTLAGGAFIFLLTQSKVAVTAWTIATSAAQAISAGITAVWGFMSGSLGILTGVFTGATVSVGAFLSTMAAAAAPIIAVGVAIAGVIAQINEFNRVSAAGREAAQGTAATGLKSGAITEQDVYDQAFKSAQAEHGDLFARLFYSNIARDVLGGANQINAGGMTVTPLGGSRATGGGVFGGATGRIYEVNENNAEWLHMRPGQSGTVSAEAPGGGGSSIQISGPFYFTAKSKAEAEEHAETFTLKLESLLRARG